MDAASRAPAPPPLKLGPVRAVSSPVDGTPRSADSTKSGSLAGDDHNSPASTTSPLLMDRQDAAATAAASETMKRPYSVAQRKINANSYCGRHSDQFLFGGKGFGDLWRAVTRK